MEKTALTVLNLRLFSCFESCKLLCYITDSTQFNITEQNVTTKWELVDAGWLTKVKEIIDRSIEKPKDAEKLGRVHDLWRRATAGYLELRSRGVKSCQELPEWISDEMAEQIRLIERRVAERRQNANLEIPGRLPDFWFCDATESWESDRFAMGSGGAGGCGESIGVVKKLFSIPVEQRKPLPEVGAEINLKKDSKLSAASSSLGRAKSHPQATTRRGKWLWG